MKKSTRKRSNNYLAVSITAALIVVAIVYYQSIHTTLPINVNEIQSSTGLATLSIAPTSVSLPLGVERAFPIVLDTKSTKATAAKIELTYDPTMISAPVIKNGSFLPNTLSVAQVKNGKATFTYAVDPTVRGVTGKGVIASIKVKPLVVGNSTISFTSGSIITAIDHGDSVLGSTTSITVSGVPASSPSPTPTPTPSPVVIDFPTYSSSPTPAPSEYTYTQTELDNLYTEQPSVWEKIVLFLRNLFI